jgi:hypothetical protein
MFIALALALAWGACSGSESGSSTPRITARSSASEALAGSLLSTDDVRSVAAQPRDVTVVSIDDLSLFENPDPRGPCGARIAFPDLGSGVGAGIQALSGLQGFEFVLRPNRPTADEFVDATESDTREGCASYTSRTNTGSMQSVKLLRVVQLPRLVDAETASVLAITNNGVRTEAATIVMRRADVVAVVGLFGPIVPTDDTLVALAEKAAEKLPA